MPTVTAISSCPDLQWMVQPMISSVAPSNGGARSYNPNPYPKMRVTGAKSPNSNKRARAEQVNNALSLFLTIDHPVHLLCPFISLHSSESKISMLSLPQLSPEEVEKKRVRRERNKMAAAKCRNRRRELTDTLQTVSILQIFVKTLCIAYYAS